MFNLFARLFSTNVFKKGDDRVGVDRISSLKTKQELPALPEDKDVKIELGTDARELWAKKKDLLSRRKTLEIGESWQSNTIKGKHQRNSRTDLKLQETRDRALNTSWEINTY